VKTEKKEFIDSNSDHMKSLMKSLYPAALGLALAGSMEAAAWPPENGDLVLGVQATAGTGSTSNVFVNLGPAFQIRENAEQGSVVNIAAELSAAFGANWFSRTDLWFGVAGNRSALSTPSEVNGDANRVVYASRAAGSPGASILFSGYTSSSLGTSGNNIQSLVGAADDLVTRGKGVVTMTSTANPVQWFNSWSKWNPTPGAAFAIFSGGIQNNFGKSSNGTPLVDIQRLTASGVTREATVGITRSGDVIVSSTASVFTAAKAIADLKATQYYVGDTLSVNVGTGLTISGGLPAGVTYDSSTGLVAGTITARPATSGLVTVKSGTTVLATLEDFSLNVSNYPFLGSYEVLILDGDSTPAGLPEGKIRVTITKPGTFSASAVVKGTTTATALTGTFTPSALFASPATLTLTFPSFTASLTLSSTSNVVTGTRSVTGSANDTLSGFRLASGPATSRNLTASFAATGGDRTSVPAGFGFATGSLASTGSASFAGTLGDGQKFTTSFNASLTDQAVVYVQPYSVDVVNSFFGGIINLPNLGQRNSAGAASFDLGQTGRPSAGLQWRKAASLAGSSYDGGFGTSTPVAVTGAVSGYTPVPSTLKAPGAKLAAQLGAKGNVFKAAYVNQTTSPADSSAASPDAVIDNEDEALPDSYLMGASPITFNDPSITGRFFNEVQVITIGGATPTTTLAMTVKVGTGAVSTAFNWNATAATTASRIQTALEGLANVGTGNVTVTADTDRIFRVTFIGARGYQDIAPITVAKSGTGGPSPTFSVGELVKGTGNALTSLLVDEVQRVAVPDTVVAFTLGFKGTTTGSIARNATQATTASNIQTALQGLSNIGLASNVSVAAAGLDGTTQLFNVTFQGALGKTNQALLTSSVASGSGALTVSEVGAGGSISARVTGTALGTMGTFSASVLLNNAGLKGTVEGVFLQDDSFGTVNGRGQVRIPVAAGAGVDFQTIPVTLSTN
jgi:hypothetical protein